MTAFDHLSTPRPVMTPMRRVRKLARTALMGTGAVRARIMARTPRGPRFSGAFPSRAAAIASLPAERRAGYDDESIADVSFPQMCRRMPWDYPMIFWLDRMMPRVRSLIDAGGHLGTKYVAFSDLVDLQRLDWTVYDLPGIVSAARKRQSQGGLPAAIRFEHDLEALPKADLLMASGLLQYLDLTLTELVHGLPQRPDFVLLNKVALRDGPALFTIERIGAGRVPYQVRNRAEFMAEIDALGYRVADSWTIPDLAHVIPTHPWTGPSESRGFALVSTSVERA